jgi:drug/metabolite transporter (DMT)-like permease
MEKRLPLQGIILLALAQTLVGFNIVVSKYLLAYIPPLVLLEIRFLLATLILLSLHWISPAGQKKMKVYFGELSPRDWLYLISQSLCAGILFNGLMLTGLHYTDANVGGIITSALPAITAFFSWLILNESISTQKVFCIIFATIGLLGIALEKIHGVASLHTFLGDGLILLAMVPEATYYIICKKYKNRLPLFLTSVVLNSINAVILFPTCFIFDWHPMRINPLLWLAAFLTGLSSGLFYVLWLRGTERVDGMMASLSTGWISISTTLLAWIILGERLSPIELTGMSMVMFSIFLYARR